MFFTKDGKSQFCAYLSGFVGLFSPLENLSGVCWWQGC